ncbi:MAG: alanine:cation symporter family protein [Firmicutes bacterium]|nr:alanine:cation symporter family protein [Bacillota bacterium]
MFSQIVSTLNGILWSTPLPVICLAGGLIFTIYLGAPQIRHIKEAVKMLFGSQASDTGLSSFQAFCLAIAGRVGTGNIAGVATGICFGGPGALFWMWMVAIFGAGTTFIECTMAQLYKEVVDGEYRGNAAYYFGKRFNFRALGLIYGVIFIAAEALTQNCLQANACAQALHNSFGVPIWLTAVLMAALIGYITFGGSKRIGRVAEMIVPVMAALYIIVALIIIFMNISAIPAAFALIFKSAFVPGSVFGGALGSAVIWGTKRAVYSSETGMSTATPSAGSAEVSHPVKQGLVQTFSIYIDTLFVCTATGLIMIMTNVFNCVGDAGEFLIECPELAGNASPGAPWAQAAIGTVFSWGPAFISIALVFFAFTTCMNQMYNCQSTLTFFFKGSTPKWASNAMAILFLIFVVIAGMMDSTSAWDFGDVGIGLITWCNMLFLFTCMGKAKALLKDYQEQKKAGKDPIFDPDKFNWPGTETWRGIRDKYQSGQLK